MRFPLDFALLAFTLAPAAVAQQQTYTLTPATSQVNFQLGGNTHAVHGSFHVTSGTVNFDESTHSMSGRILVDPLTGDSGNSSRDQKMKKEVLEANRFSEISFQPQSFQGTIAPAGDSTVQVSGNFNLHGASHNLTVPMHLHRDGKHLTAETTFTVPYVQWGLKDPSIFVLKVAKEVSIELKLDGQL